MPGRLTGRLTARVAREISGQSLGEPLVFRTREAEPSVARELPSSVDGRTPSVVSARVVWSIRWVDSRSVYLSTGLASSQNERRSIYVRGGPCKSNRWGRACYEGWGGEARICSFAASAATFAPTTPTTAAGPTADGATADDFGAAAAPYDSARLGLLSDGGIHSGSALAAVGGNR